MIITQNNKVRGKKMYHYFLINKVHDERYQTYSHLTNYY